MKATLAIKPSEVKRDWIVVDAAGKRFGKVLTEVATLLRGKHKPYFTPNVDCGDPLDKTAISDYTVYVYRNTVRGIVCT